MKKRSLIIIAAAITIALAAFAAYAITNQASTTTKACASNCANFTDANKDGVCDVAAKCHKDGKCDPSKCPPGKCDPAKCGTKCDPSKCPGHQGAQTKCDPSKCTGHQGAMGSGGSCPGHK
ncbi:hypothetical protein EHM69_07870 [candidate division KSB1 bacterium]|nr:MAG: hypothetical protein EHM69_07870 [candidate division KSB1 bacterium]